MRNAAFLAAILVLLLIQDNLSRVIAPLGLHGWTPSLLLPLVVFLGVHEPSAARGSLLAFVIGHGLDLLGAAPLWLFTFTYVALWWLARVAGVRLAAQTIPTRMLLAFGFSLIEALIVLVILVIFGSDPQRPVELAAIVMPHAAATALLAPVIFRLALGIHQGTSAAPRAAEEPR
jgi:cell shape-determining protein MreD